MKNAKSKIFILVASAFVGFLIINSINMDGATENLSSLNAVDYKKAVEERNQLYKEIESINKENTEFRHKISKYDGNSPEKSEQLIEDMKNQLVDYGALSGITTIKGPGLVIKMKDADRDILDTEFEAFRKIIHEDDVAQVLNELKYAGAQAIAMNDHRIIPNSAVKCYWALIGFEDESSTIAPFYIYALGNPEEMKTVLLSENSVIQKLLLRKIQIEIEEKDEIIIPATKQNTEAKYMERYDKK